MPKLIESVTVEVVYVDGSSERVALRATEQSQIRGNTDLGYAPESDDDVGLLDAQSMPTRWPRTIALAVRFEGGAASYTPTAAPVRAAT